MATIRRARPDDAHAIARVHVESWRSTYAGIIPNDVLLKLSVHEHEARWWRHVLGRFSRHHYVYVAEDAADGVVGFASGGPSRTSGLSFAGEVYTLYLRDDYHGRGLGRRLFLALSRRLVDAGWTSLVVWVLQDNPSRFFYEAMGGRFAATRRTAVGDATLSERAYGWADARALLELGQSGEPG